MATFGCPSLSSYLSAADSDFRIGVVFEPACRSNQLTERHLSLFWWPKRKARGETVVADGMRGLRQIAMAPFESIRGDERRILRTEHPATLSCCLGHSSGRSAQEPRRPHMFLTLGEPLQ